VKFSSNWVGHPASGVNKILHMWIAGVNRVFLAAYGSGSDPLQADVYLQQIASNNGSAKLTPNLNSSAATIKRGQWQRWELLLTTNTAGNADGSAQWWIDGIRVGAYYNLGYVGASDDHTWQFTEWAPTWGGLGDAIAAAQSEQIDHIYVSGAP
jgi:hypothetical protein